MDDSVSSGETAATGSVDDAARAQLWTELETIRPPNQARRDWLEEYLDGSEPPSAALERWQSVLDTHRAKQACGVSTDETGWLNQRLRQIEQACCALRAIQAFCATWALDGHEAFCIVQEYSQSSETAPPPTAAETTPPPAPGPPSCPRTPSCEPLLDADSFATTMNDSKQWPDHICVFVARDSTANWSKRTVIYPGDPEAGDHRRWPLDVGREGITERAAADHGPVIPFIPLAGRGTAIFAQSLSLGSQRLDIFGLSWEVNWPDLSKLSKRLSPMASVKEREEADRQRRKDEAAYLSNLQAELERPEREDRWTGPLAFVWSGTAEPDKNIAKVLRAARRWWGKWIENKPIGAGGRPEGSTHSAAEKEQREQRDAKDFARAYPRFWWDYYDKKHKRPSPDYLYDKLGLSRSEYYKRRRKAIALGLLADPPERPVPTS
jgi:hypothetical protein